MTDEWWSTLITFFDFESGNMAIGSCRVMCSYGREDAATDLGMRRPWGCDGLGDAATAMWHRRKPNFRGSVLGTCREPSPQLAQSAAHGGLRPCR